jgi:hypothetical protein
MQESKQSECVCEIERGVERVIYRLIGGKTFSTEFGEFTTEPMGVNELCVKLTRLLGSGGDGWKLYV